MSKKSISSESIRLRRAVYVCVAMEFAANLGSAINTVPATRLIEGAVCQRFYGTEILLAEQLCKSAGVQSDMAYLLGALASFGSIPSLLLTIPYGILSEHVDRRYILLANSISSIFRLLFNIAVCYAPHTNLKLLWVSATTEIVGGGGTVFMMILRTIIAENVPAASLTTILYKMSGVNLLIRLAGVSFGSWLLSNGAASTSLLSVCISGLVIPLLTFLPETESYIQTSDAISIPLSYIKVNSESSNGGHSDYNQLDSVKPQTKSSSTIRRFKADVIASLKSLATLMLHSRSFNMCLAIMFLNTVALDARQMLRPWLSKRYDWTLAQTGYILSLESILSVSILFLLQYIDSSKKWRAKSDLDKRKRELWIAKMSIVCGIVGSTILCFAKARILFFLAAVVISGSAGFLDITKAYFTSQLAKQDIGRLYSTIMVIDTLATILSSPVWSSVYAVGYDWGGMWIGLPFIGSAGVFCLILTLLMMLKV